MRAMVSFPWVFLCSERGHQAIQRYRSSLLSRVLQFDSMRQKRISHTSHDVKTVGYPFLTASCHHNMPHLSLRRLQLIPLLQELAGGARALDTRLEELSRQSLFAREMLEREALRWERQHLHAQDWGSGAENMDQSRAAGSSDDGVTGQADAIDVSDETESGSGVKVKVPSAGLGVSREEFPLPAFLKANPRAGSGGEGLHDEQRRTGSNLPEMVREELLHRFVIGELHMMFNVLRSLPFLLLLQRETMETLRDDSNVSHVRTCRFLRGWCTLPFTIHTCSRKKTLH